MKKHLLFLLIGLLIITPSVWSENASEETLVFSTVLYGNENDIPLNINSSNDWVDIISINTEEINALTAPLDGIVRKWRIKSSYSDNTVAGQSTIQIKLHSDSGKTPIFTLPWSEGKIGWKENYSNWFQTDFDGQLPLLGERAVSSIRMIAPPGSSNPGMIYKIELEAWDLNAAEETESVQSVIQRAAISSIPEIKAVNIEATDKQIQLHRKVPAKDNALVFALTFINDSLGSDLPSFYSSLNQTVYSLETGDGDSKFRVKPPQNNYSGITLGDYTDSYETRIYDYSEYSIMFPQWIDDNRKWKPDVNTYLFHGSALKDGKEGFISDEIFVFMCKEIDGEWKLIAIPE